jgi:hypothetical protein
LYTSDIGGYGVTYETGCDVNSGISQF